MQGPRSRFDAERSSVTGPTAEKTDVNAFELLCGMCGERIYVDRPTFEKVRAAIEQGLDDNPLLCVRCELEYEREMYDS